MNIVWNKVTPLSQLVAILLFVGIFAFGIYLGMHIELQQAMTITPAVTSVPAAPSASSANSTSDSPATVPLIETYKCSSGKEIQITHKEGTTSFALESARSTYDDCSQIAAPSSM